MDRKKISQEKYIPKHDDDGNQNIRSFRNLEEGDVQYVDPFAYVLIRTLGAQNALFQQSGRDMLIYNKYIANRGRMSFKADLDGLQLNLVKTEGSIASFDVHDQLVQDLNGWIY